MPPFAASQWVPTFVQTTVQKALSNCHVELSQILSENGFSKFVKVVDEDYSDIREVITFVEKTKK